MLRFPSLFLLVSLVSSPVFAKTVLWADAKPAKPATKGASLEPEAEQWKGKPYDTNVQLSAMAGIGVLGNSAGFGINFAAAFKILHQGFVDDINDQVYLELVGGPLFVSGSTSGFYGGHLRWEFHKNDMWTFYAIGGLGGNFGGVGSITSFYPRFGLGTYWNLFQFMSFRFELSHEFTGIGVAYLL